MEDPPAFDLDAYASRYYGRGKVQRLRFIADTSPPLRQDALRLAILEARRCRDTQLYKETVHQGNMPDILADDEIEQDDSTKFAMDKDWIRTTDQWAAKELDKLRKEVDENKHQSNKEVIRTGHFDMGDFYHKRGKLQLARGEYVKTRDYCTQPRHTIQMCTRVIAVSIEDNDFSHVEHHFIMADNTPEVDRNSADLSRMRACSGLAFLVRKSYSHAANRFLDTCKEKSEDRVAILAKEFGDIMSLEDVATYGSLCALATLDRACLAREVINRVEFKNLLELVPDVREMVYDFYNTRYTRCLQTMEKIKPDLEMDMYLGRHDHITALYNLIRRKALVQYVSPFVSADLVRMANVFNTDADALMNELFTLIEDQAINARIDTQAKALHAKRANVRLEALSSSIEKGQESFDEAEALLLRMTLLQNNIQISSHSSSGPSAAGSALGNRAGSISSVVDTVFDRGGFRH